jgi:hypothetical protein
LSIFWISYNNHDINDLSIILELVVGLLGYDYRILIVERIDKLLAFNVTDYEKMISFNKRKGNIKKNLQTSG